MRNLVAIALSALVSQWTVAETATPAAHNAVINIGAINGQAITAQGAGDWFTVGRNYAEDRFSPLDQVNASNINTLGLAWAFDTEQTRGMEATPIVVDGVMYTTGSWSKVFALDARSGKQLWSFDPKIAGEAGRKGCCDVVNRGVAVWQGRVYVGALDGRLIALDAKTGQKQWEVMTVNPAGNQTITGAPRIVKGMVVIGNGGSEFGARGYFTAYEAETGQQRWRFYTVPDGRNEKQESPELEQALKTWPKNAAWETGGGGTAWDSMAFDPELNLLYVGVGNGSPWNRQHRSPGGGDNLYLSSIVAVNPDTGRLVWHYQTTPKDSWDYTATQHMILADIKLQDGKLHKVIMQAPKNGFFYVLDRASGKLISAKNYVDISWASHVDMQTGRPVELPRANWEGDKMVIQRPGPLGAHSWQPMSFSPNTGLVYIPAMDVVNVFLQQPTYSYKPGQMNVGMDTAKLGDMGKQAPYAPPFCSNGRLVAWDPVQQKEAWHVYHDTYWNGGVLSTAGNLVFQGTEDGRFVAYSADKGEKLWEFKTTIAIMAAPMSYSLDGEQYVAVMVGAGGIAPLMGTNYPVEYQNRGYVLAFKLGGQLPMPAVAPRKAVKPDIGSFDVSKITPEQVDKGYKLYLDHCIRCHGIEPGHHGTLPTLKEMSPQTHAEFDAIVIGGLRREKGMVSFADVLSIEDSQAIHAYVVHETVKEVTNLDKLGQWVKQNSCLPQWLVTQ